MEKPNLLSAFGKIDGILGCKISFDRILAMLFLVSVLEMNILADQFVDAGGDSWDSRRSGRVCFLTRTEANSEINLARWANGKFELLFSTNIGVTQYPICLERGLVAIDSAGIIHKFDEDGRVVFAVKPTGFEGASGLSGRVNERCVYMSATSMENGHREWSYYLYIVDVSASIPSIKAKFRIVQPLRIAPVVDNTIIVVGRTNVLRFPMPK